MNRHHPYGGYDSGTRRGGYQSTSGPDRSHRFDSRGGMPVRGGRGGFARGRGGGPASYDGHMNMPSYDSSGPAYSGNFDSGTQGSYQQMNYPVGPSDYNSSNGYDNGQGYGDNNNYEGIQGDDYSKRPPRRGKDEKTSEAMIEERIQREKPCRTLFIRNIKYETDSQDIRRLFEEHGEIKTFFDLISTRGMVFVTYYDLRAAERARDRLQGSEISGRPIDVHYSLPRDDRNGDRDRNQQMQGTLQVTLRGSSSGLVIDDNEVRRKFQQFGDVKSVRPVNDRIDSRYVEFYDIRACHEAYDRLRHQGLQDGVMDILFAWDLNDEGHGSASGSGGQNRNWDNDDDRGTQRGRGGFRGRGRGRGGRWEDESSRRDDYGRDRDVRRGGRYDDYDRPRGGRGGYNNRDRYDSGGGRGGYDHSRRGGYDHGSGGGYGGGYGGDPGGYGSPPSNSYNNSSRPPPSSYSAPPPPPPTLPSTDDRLEQAKKVQQLLAALKQPAPTPAPAPGPAPAAPPAGMGMVPPMPPAAVAPPAAGAGSASFYPLTPGSYPPMSAMMPPSSGATYGAPPSASSSAGPPTATGGLPPNLLSLLQSHQSGTGTPPNAQPYVNVPAPGPMLGQPPNVGQPPEQSYQQLMSYLAQQSAPKP